MTDFLDALAEECHSIAEQHGFWEDKSDAHIAAKIALLHGEVSELLEAIRCAGGRDEHCPDFLAEEVEAADVLIRLLDLCAACRWRIGAAVEAKMQYNKSRSFKHGKRF